MINSCWQTDVEPHHHEDPWGRFRKIEQHELFQLSYTARWRLRLRRPPKLMLVLTRLRGPFPLPNSFQDSPSKIGFQLTKWKSTDNECGSAFNHIHIYSHRVPVHSVHIWFWDSDCVTSHWRTWRHKQNERRHWLRQKRPRKRQRHATLPRIFAF